MAKATCHFVHDRQFMDEMNAVEPNSKHQTRLQHIIEDACNVRIRSAPEGYGFARIFWKRKLLVWYEASYGDVTLLSIRPDTL